MEEQRERKVKFVEPTPYATSLLSPCKANCIEFQKFCNLKKDLIKASLEFNEKEHAQLVKHLHRQITVAENERDRAMQGVNYIDHAAQRHELEWTDAIKRLDAANQAKAEIIKGLEKTLSDCNTKIARYEACLKQLSNGTVVRLGNEINDLRNTIEALEEEIHLLRSEPGGVAVSLSEENAKVKTSVSQRQFDLEASETQINHPYKQECELCQNRIQELLEDLRKARKENGARMSRDAQYKARLRGLWQIYEKNPHPACLDVFVDWMMGYHTKVHSRDQAAGTIDSDGQWNWTTTENVANERHGRPMCLGPGSCAREDCFCESSPEDSPMNEEVENGEEEMTDEDGSDEDSSSDESHIQADGECRWPYSGCTCSTAYRNGDEFDRAHALHWHRVMNNPLGKPGCSESGEACTCGSAVAASNRARLNSDESQDEEENDADDEDDGDDEDDEDDEESASLCSDSSGEDSQPVHVDIDDSGYEARPNSDGILPSQQAFINLWRSLLG